MVSIRVKYGLLGDVYGRFRGAMIFKQDNNHVILITSG